MKPIKFVYRVVFKKSEGYIIYYLHEEDGKYYFISPHPANFYGSSCEDLQRKLKLYEEALKLPAINYEDIKEYTSENVSPPDNTVKNFKY
jgi:hypothetical protein